MTITVENGSNVTGANSYVTHTELAAYAALRNVTLTTVQADREALLIAAMDWLNQYANRWKGNRTNNVQALEWPRRNVILYDAGPYLDQNTIPAELKNLQMTVALAAISVDLLPNHEVGQKGAVIEETVHGAVTVRYENSGKLMRLPAVTSAEAFLGVLLRRSGLLSVGRA
jgi:hypothetical protein